ncbi:MAG: hypothetical protein KJZ95_00985 [Caldilinea sp.]|nr:hypothetical protein [Caldilinea sp.]
MRDPRRHKVEYGDFQTPIDLAREVCSLIARTGFHPASILEPTCGTGSFLRASIETFPEAVRVLGFEINPQYVVQAQQTMAVEFPQAPVVVSQSDFFVTRWSEVVALLADPILVIGNPPWVTNSGLGALGSKNVPTKSNLDNLNGIDALTGKSNFDISEWVIRKNLEWLQDRHGMLAMLCKTTVARKILLYAWQHDLKMESASLYRLDAETFFAAAVDACLLVIKTHATDSIKECKVFDSLDAQIPTNVFGFRDGMLIANIELFEKWRRLAGRGLKGWRSGIKHDCSKVFELRLDNDRLMNGLGQPVEIESQVIFPMLKSSDLAMHRKPHRWMIVPQKTMDDDPVHLELDAPRTWRYLAAHSQSLDSRKSAIYRNRPRFSVFGVGGYSFAPYKVAISGLYKKLAFVQIEPARGRPVVLDDTCYFFPCHSEEESDLLYELVTSDPAQEFWSALVFWDAKRPITAQLLNALDLMALAKHLGKECEVARALAERQIVEYREGAYQRLLFRETSPVYRAELATDESKGNL